ncbi:BON domain-containing protein [Permianibacter aggregans]|uniref:Osmotically-inducible protein OsmY n=1 Tax=Permianibacter aggregans TaxID=1510150 RepID=A0A4R6UGX9_9GAMM|nr:BON domain-containing protein [Permianibacter aggregans]QGX39259.1 BON domain-containing protein [Permianibacter aggregans]TDQ46068.1 osmotically-inducible protein OsmY [Permianibacter aggregans]
MLARILALVVMVYLSTGCVGVAVVGAGAGAVMADDPRSFGTQIDDENIESRALRAIRDNNEISAQSHVEVVSYNRVVLVVGQTPAESYRTQIGQLVAEVPNVRKVYNEVKVTVPRSALTAMSDSTITSKIKSALLVESEFPSSNVKVVTENSEVFLMGLVTRKQAERATEIARTTNGVEKVVQIFEIQES